MDARHRHDAARPALSVTAAGACIPAGGDDTMAQVLPFLRTPKTRKFMGKQDRMAVIAAGRALAGAGLDAATLSQRTGFYLAVGYIPFDRTEIEMLARHSVDGGEFSMARFSGEGIHRVNPLLTFRCLPNMPMFHVSVNFGIQGGYFVTYPGAGQLYVALEEAVRALEAGDIDCAIVGGVADQDNFLVAFDHARAPPFPGAAPADAAAFFVLERDADAAARGDRPRMRLESLDVRYSARGVVEVHEESTTHATGDERRYLGPASLPAAVEAAWRTRAPLRHTVRTRDGYDVQSAWEPA